MGSVEGWVHGMVIVEGKEVLGVNLGRPIVTNGDDDALFTNYFGEDFVMIIESKGKLKYALIDIVI